MALDHLTAQGLLHKAMLAGVSAMVVGGGVTLLQTATKEAVLEARLDIVEHAARKLDDVDRNVTILNGKLDVLNQKLDDNLKAAHPHDPSIR